MKTIRFAIVALVVLLCTAGAFGQTAMTQTFLTAALTDTGNVAAVNSTTDFSVGNFAFANGEYMLIQAVNTTTKRVTIARGQSGGGAPRSHLLGTVVFVGPSNRFGPSDPKGSCTAASQPYLPLVIPSTGHLADCIDSQWAIYDPNAYARKVNYCTSPVGSVAYGSVGTSSTQAVGTGWVVNLDLPGTKLLTGIRVLNNATVGTNKWIAYLYPMRGGAPIISSALAGTTTAGADAFQALAFTTPVVVPPGRYWVAIQGNGTTDGLRTVATLTFVDLLSQKPTGVFGTAFTLTPPTTFTADYAPYVCAY